jgi:hypothetical protein
MVTHTSDNIHPAEKNTLFHGALNFIYGCKGGRHLLIFWIYFSSDNSILMPSVANFL